MFGYEIPVVCHVEKIEGLSAHADRSELLNWLKHFKKRPKNIFVFHGKTQTSESFAKTIKQDFGWNVATPEYKETVEGFNFFDKNFTLFTVQSDYGQQTIHNVHYYS